MFDAVLSFADGSGRLILSDKSLSNLALKVSKEVASKEAINIQYSHIEMGENLVRIGDSNASD